MNWWGRKSRPKRMPVTRLVLEPHPAPGTPVGGTEELQIDPRLVTRIQDLLPGELPEEFRTRYKSPTRIVFATGSSIVVGEDSSALMDAGLGPPAGRSSRAAAPGSLRK